MNRREVLRGSGALVAAAATGIHAATAQAPIVIKFSHVVATDAPKGKASEKFKELAEVWGKLPEKERAKALLELTRDMSPRYREVIENYLKNLQRGDGKP